ncbi:hypothetical protein [Synoicihabitans lomoniglobus]|uniref:Uncharacterized protein n=1 Tax=Synoicihabitans lomoniglobus TaxID=2909285 RepID=A0AAE9ZTZ0_9BACT|nr:hypothetical protein [Opitutaceae bacterium LMO-M01]WED64231.1 hypothetical protein PXH66_17985 [Opitutaceae bacterium LMO-M01]
MNVPLKLRVVALGTIVCATGHVVPAATPPSIQQTVASRSAPDSRPYLLFLGADLAVKAEDTWWKIDGVERDWFLSHVGELPTRIPMNRPGFEFTFEQALKVSANLATLGDVVAKSDYTRLNDPGRRWLESQALAISGIDAEVNAATRKLRALNAAAEQRQAVLNNPNSDPLVVAAVLQEPAPDTAGAMRDLSTAVQGMGSEQFDPSFYARRKAETEGSGEQHDALRLRFTLSPRHDLVDPYALIYVEFAVADPAEFRAHRRVFAEPLRPMTAGETAKVDLLKGGFPPGFTFDHVRVHLFDAGREVPTNQSERRTPVTREETFQFLVLDHVSRHRTAKSDAPAELMKELLTPEGRAALNALDVVCFGRVTADGRLAGLFHDAAGTRPWPDADTGAALQDLRFKPTVVAGEAVATIVPLAVPTR